MANKENSIHRIGKEIDKKYTYLDTNYERFDGRINLVFVVSLGALTAVWSLLVSGDVSYMNTVAGVIFGVSFWAVIICGSLILRNSGKAQTNQKLTNIETKIDQMGTKINNLIDSQQKLIDHIGTKFDALIESQQNLVNSIDKLIKKMEPK